MTVREFLQHLESYNMNDEELLDCELTFNKEGCKAIGGSYIKGKAIDIALIPDKEWAAVVPLAEGTSF